MVKAKADLKIAKAINKGNEKVFNQFFKEYYPKVFRFVMSRVKGDRDLADDFTQQSLCKALDKIDTFRGEATLFTWVCQISRSIIYAYQLKENRRNKIISPVTDTTDVREILENIAMNEMSQPDNIAENFELNNLISEILDNLPNNYGDILEWKYVEQLSVSQIAEKLNTSLTSVQSSLARARDSFKTVIQKMMKNDKIKDTFSFIMEQ
jgi:RNA polymerase sigma-70 factor (ECF subfamily)